MLFVLPQLSNACSCALEGDFKVEEVEEYDYVALVKIGKITPMDTSNRDQRPWFYYAEFTEISNFKGETPTQLMIYGGHPSFGYWTSCDLGVDVDEEWLLFGEKVDGKISIGSCSRSVIYRKANGVRDWSFNRGIEQLILLDSAFNKVSADYLQINVDSIFYDNGQLERSQEFKNGELHGKVNYFFPDGTVYGSSRFKKGFQNGHFYWNTSNGNLELEGKKRRGKNFKKRIFYSLGSPNRPRMISIFDKNGETVKFLDYHYEEKENYLGSKTVYNRKNNKIITTYYNQNGLKTEINIRDFQHNQIDLIQFDEKGKRIK
jgi:antitoxin component YwqK of YwqJK toxin-antitoxin module